MDIQKGFDIATKTAIIGQWANLILPPRRAAKFQKPATISVASRIFSYKEVCETRIEFALGKFGPM